MAPQTKLVRDIMKSRLQGKTGVSAIHRQTGTTEAARLDTVDPTTPIFDKSKVEGRSIWFAKLIAVLAVGGTVALIVVAFIGSRENRQIILFGLAAAWATLAPFWFFFEFHYFYRVAPGKNSWELFKHGQQLGTAVWAAVATTLYALGSSDMAKPAREQLNCTVVLPAVVAPNTPIAATINCSK